MDPTSNGGSAALPRTFRLSWREVRVPLGRTAMMLWLPALLPFVAGPLTECDHCVANYWQILPVMPGLLAGLWAGPVSALFYVSAGIATLLLVALLATFVGLLDRRWWILALPVALLSGVQAIGLSHLLRM